MTAALPTPRPVLVAFVGAALLNLVSVAVQLAWLEHVTKPLLCGLLLVWAWLACERRPPWLLVAGLVAALVGDVTIGSPGTTMFIVGMGAFLVMQVCYILGFWRLGAGARLRARPWVPAAWGLLWLVLNVVVGPSLGSLQVPVLVYSAALVTMAATAVGTGVPRVGPGGVSFLVSDAVIGLGAAGLHVPGRGVIVMATYSLAQFLIVTGWVLAVRAPGDVARGRRTAR